KIGSLRTTRPLTKKESLRILFCAQSRAAPKIKKQILGSNVGAFLDENSYLARGLRKMEPSGSKGSDFDFSRLSFTVLNV
ncbi:MAG: hypothetical protein IJ803_09615, partial [Oribacterium sp.]|nr:hypothetical protein [Oribacterium sp.]